MRVRNDRQDKISGTGQPGQGRQTGHSEHDSEDWTARTGQGGRRGLGHDSPGKASGIGQLERTRKEHPWQDSHSRKETTGRPEHDGTGKLGQDIRGRTA
jgi:hypothetical protein